jgi:hypothetical protein
MSRAQELLIRPRPVGLADAGLAPREPARPEHLRAPDYDVKFDSETLFFDVKWVAPRRVVAFGPPLANNLDHMYAMRIRAHPSNEFCTFRVKAGLDRHSQLWIDAPEQSTALTFDVAGHCVTVPVSPADHDFLRGRRVLMTLSKDNDLVWIQDWARYYRDVHGADAVVVYDNSSSSYGDDDILAALRAVEGLCRIVVVAWPFKYGPQALRPGVEWDSDFAQPGMLEHCRHTLLPHAASAVNVDIDELVVSRRGRPLFAAIESAMFATVRFEGRWVPGLASEFGDAAGDTLSRHQDFRYVDVDAKCLPKWGVVPSRCPESSQWSVHRIKGWRPAYLMSRDFQLRHFRHINTGWKDRRDERDEIDTVRHRVDEPLARSFSAVRWEL